MQISKHFGKIILGSLILAWMAATFIPALWGVFKGLGLVLNPSSKVIESMEISVSIIGFWAFVGVLGLGIVWGIFLTCYWLVKSKKLPKLTCSKNKQFKEEIKEVKRRLDSLEEILYKQETHSKENNKNNQASNH